MKIICVARNYKEHAHELGNTFPESPILFIKSDTAVLPKKQDFYIPNFTNEVHYELEFIVKINKVGKCIAKKFAHKYYDQVSVGIDFTARDLQSKMKSEGLPWEIAKSFDGSAVIGEWIFKSQINILNSDIKLEKNKQVVQQGNIGEMAFSIDEIIAYASQFFTLKTGDIIFTGTPAGVGAVRENDRLEAYLNNAKLIELNIK